MRLAWRPQALADRDAIMNYIAKDNPTAAIALDDDYKPGRLRGTREIVVQPNYVMIYRIQADVLEILRVLHARQQWPVHR